MKRMSCKWLSLGLLISAGCLITGCARARVDAEASELPVVAVAKVTPGDLDQKLTLTAEFKPYQEVDVHAKVAGYIRTIRVDVGDRVKLGELLATLEIPELQDEVEQANATIRQREAELARSRSAHQVAHLAYTRLEEVVKVKPDLVAQQEVDDAFAKDQTTDAQVSSAEHNVEAASDARKRLQTMYAYSTISAPFTGVITKRYADTGAMIQAGTSSASQSMPVVRVSQNDLLRLIVPVPESAVPRIHLGTSVQVRVPALNKTIEGKVARFADTLDLDTRTMDTEIDVSNPKLEMVPGMYAEATVILEHRPNVLTVPVQALDHNGGKVQVYVVGSDGSVQERTVQVGLENPSKVEIASGLKADELVIVSSRGQLRPGERVKPKSLDPTSPQQEI